MYLFFLLGPYDSLCKWQPNGILLPIAGKPNGFVQCDNWRAVCKDCPAGLVFQMRKNGVCDYPPAAPKW